MTLTTVSMRKELRDQLVAEKLAGDFPSLEAVIENLLIDKRRKRLRESSELMRRKMKEKGLKLEDLIR